MLVELDNEKLVYSGRIDKSNPKKPEFVFSASYVKFTFVGKRLVVDIKNNRLFDNNSVGVIVDGVQEKYSLKEEGVTTLDIINDEEDKKHKVMIFKRLDSCHTYSIEKIEISDNAILLDEDQLPKRKIEVYGDSISCGGASEALEYIGKDDPEENGGDYSNSWYSFSWILARSVGAELHNVSQGGIPLLTGTGWVHPPIYLGMEDMWDKVHYHPGLKKETAWNFSKYTPHLVIIELGQNDSTPEDYMKEEPKGEKAENWKKRYKEFILDIRNKYPKAFILLTTSLMYHDESWDKAIGEVCSGLNDERVKQYLYKRNGTGSPGHMRIPEAEEMANELKEFIETLDFDIWESI